MLSVEDGYRSLREGREQGRVVVPRDFIEVRGDDAVSYLQGQLSQDVGSLGLLSSTCSLLLAPTGKLGWWIRVTRHASPGTLILDVDAGAGPQVLERLNRFKLRSDVQFELDDGRFDWHCWADDRSNGTAPTPSFEGSDSFPTAWPGAAGWDHLCQQDDPPAVTIPLEAYEAVRIEAGVPRAGAEITDDVIPAELGQWLIDQSVSFTKGCYTGQELVARIDSRGGNVPRHLRGLVLEGDQVPEPGAVVSVGDDVVGAVTSAAWSPGLAAPIAMAFIARRVEVPARALVTVAGIARPTEIRGLPLVGAGAA